MIRLGSKEKRCYTSPPPPLTRSQTYPLERIRLEMKEEILMKLKGKCISKFISISKSWSSIVCSKRFTNLYLNQSMAPPRILFSLTVRGDNEMQLFYSCSQEDPSSDHQTFSVIKLPSDGYVQYLSHYGEKIAAANILVTGTFDMWVLEDASKSHWSQVSIVIPSWTDSYDQFDCFTLRGRLGTGELVFAPVFVTDPFYILCYDLKENRARKIQIEGIGTHLTHIHIYLDHVESPMFLEL
ncbi:PREDICTED: putative F-box protein At3g10790 [Camelina sativa]|uniref:F-box protein At3g10790 n=1 Tax=Camelina sativa TaxID=90675 RepID=A0ABM0Y4S7_CAMSA|nr:PREDICTED: putative F-box protein At3g10790 [Camelina sativa]